MTDEPKTKIIAQMEITLQPRQFEPIKIHLGVEYAFEPFATGQELRELFQKASPVILEQMGIQFEQAYEKQKEIRKKMGVI